MVMLVNSNSSGIDTVTTINTVIKIGYLVVAITEIGNNFGYPHRLHLLGTIAVVHLLLVLLLRLKITICNFCKLVFTSRRCYNG
jgi:hypothetical protein